MVTRRRKTSEELLAAANAQRDREIEAAGGLQHYDGSGHSRMMFIRARAAEAAERDADSPVSLADNQAALDGHNASGGTGSVTVSSGAGDLGGLGMDEATGRRRRSGSALSTVLGIG